MSKRGTVIKSVGGVFAVLDDSDTKFVCYSPKKFRYAENNVIIGDKVLFDELRHGKGVITEVCPRKNKLNRPEIANVDVCIVVIAASPAPDFFLVDKVLINCFQQGIEPVIAVNKSDLTESIAQTVRDNYESVAEIVETSALNGSVESLRPFLSGKLACFAGQSAVGKTSVLNALLPEVKGATGGLSEKTGRGMHTTRHAVLYRTEGGGLIADTCGFSLCDLDEIRSDELRLYLDDFVRIADACKFASCTHTVEPDCAVRKAVQDGKVCKARYDRYIAEFAELKEAEKNRY